VAEYDYVVVGAGSSGVSLPRGCPKTLRQCPVARGRRTKSRRRKNLRAAPRMGIVEHAPRLGVHDDPAARALNREMFWPRGKVLGGSSCLNGMIYIRGAPADYDHWAYLGNAGWDYENVLPISGNRRTITGRIALSRRWRAAFGPAPHSSQSADRRFIESAVNTGHPINYDFSGPELVGAGYADTTTMRDGRRCSVALLSSYPRTIAAT